jgi:anti-sigma factor RsiW
MRTEDDVRAAFGSLEPEIEADPALSTRVARAHRQRNLRRRAGSLLAAAGISAAAVVAVTGGLTASHSQVTATTVRAKLLAAWVAAGNDILVTHFGSAKTGPEISAEDSWVYPWAASPGQRVQLRSVDSYGGKTGSEMTCSYRMPANPQQKVTAPGIFVNYVGRAWSNTTVVGCMSEMDPAAIRSQVASGAWTVSGPTEFRGHQALKLTETTTVHVKPGKIAQSTDQLWVDASTYLPLYEYTTTSGVDAGPPFTASFELLPPSPANLALLNVVIPPGFTHLRY